MNMLRKPLPAGVGEMLIATFCFACMNLCVRFLSRLPTHETVFFRALGVLLLAGGALYHLKISPWGNHKLWLLLRGFWGTMGLNLYFWTLQHMPLASAVTIQYLSPIFSSLVAIRMLGERPPRRQWFFFALSFVGVLLIKGFDTRLSWWALGMGILAALCSALAYNYVRKLKDYDHPLVIVFYFPLVTLVLTGPWTLTHWVWPVGIEWLWVVLLGLFTHFAQYFLTQALQAQKIAVVSQLNYVGMIYALAMGWFFFGEYIPPLAMLGLCLIVIGVMGGSFNQKDKSNINAQQLNHANASIPGR